jgi:hypothetical protein
MYVATASMANVVQISSWLTGSFLAARTITDKISQDSCNTTIDFEASQLCLILNVFLLEKAWKRVVRLPYTTIDEYVSSDWRCCCCGIVANHPYRQSMTELRSTLFLMLRVLIRKNIRLVAWLFRPLDAFPYEMWPLVHDRTSYR